MAIIYKCTNRKSQPPEHWYGEAQILRKEPFLELEVTARGSCFHILAGKYLNGRFLCIPNWNIGVDIVDPGDKFWNIEHLMNNIPEISRVDAISIVEALAAIASRN